MDPSGNEEENIEQNRKKVSDKPAFGATTKDLVNYSLGLAGTRSDRQLVEMEVDENEEEDTTEDPVEVPQSATYGLSTYYNVSEEDEHIRSITNEYLEGPEDKNVVNQINLFRVMANAIV